MRWSGQGDGVGDYAAEMEKAPRWGLLLRSRCRSGAETAAQLLGDSVVEDAGLLDGDPGKVDRGRCGDGDENPGDQRGEQAENGRSLESEDELGVLEMHDNRGGTQRLDVVDDGQRQQEGEDRKTAEADEGDIDGAVQALPGAAMAAGGEMFLVVNTHFGGDP